jgi:coenzyme F420-reducing hydrogenase delta subunit
VNGLLEHIGIESGRIHFSWISSAEATKFVEVANTVSEEVKALGPARHFIKTRAEVA